MIAHPVINTDPDCGLEPDAIPEFWEMGNGLMAVHPAAPGNGVDPFHMEGAVDYVVYHNKSDVDGIDAYGYPMCSTAVEIFCWDPTNPFTMLPPRNGVGTASIADFEFDGYGRLILALPISNAIAITDVVHPPEMIVVQRIIGGAEDGTSHQPGDFYGPNGVAVDPRNQEIYITDTGLNRVQVFDNQGNFIRMFGTGIAGTGLNLTSPHAIEVDSFGNVYIDVANEPHLIILNEFGEPISYGSIDGFARDKTTGVTLDNCLVSISSTYREYLTTTDENGYFRFDSVPQGSHTLIAQRDGYKAGYGEAFVNGGYKTNITIYMDRVGFGESGYGTISGKLMSSIDGDQITGLIVTIKGLGITDTTNFEGSFRLVGVPVGEHVMQILSNSVVLYEQDVMVNSDVDTPLGFIYLPL